MKKLSKAFRDQKETPIERAMWWMEWILRNPNSKNMKSPVIEMGYIVGNSYDIVIVSVLVTLLMIFVLIKICTAIMILFKKINNYVSVPSKIKTM